VAKGNSFLEIRIAELEFIMNNEEPLNKIASANSEKRIGVVEVVLPIFPILLPYNYGLSSVGMLLIFSIAVGYLFVSGRLYINKWLLLLGSFILLHHLVLMLFLDEVPYYMINNLIVSFIILLIIFILCGHINEVGLYRVWKLIGIFVMLGLFYHAICVYWLGINVKPIRILPMPFEGSQLWLHELPRPSSFFTEPAAFATYMMPLLFMALRNREFIFSVVITLSIILSTSSSGILLAVLMWLYLAFNSNANNRYKFMMLFLIFFIIIAINYVPMFEYSLNKITNTEINDNIRLVRGYEIYLMLPDYEKIFGIVAPNLHDYLIEGKVWLPWMSYTRDSLLGYTNTISSVFIHYGIIGGFIFLLLFYKMFKNEDKSCRGYLLIMFVSIFGQSIFFDGYFLLQFIFYYGICNKYLNGKDYFAVSFVPVRRKEIKI
jgi:hypothetical protein